MSSQHIFANPHGVATELQVLGAIRGALAGAVLAPAYSLAYAVTALVWTPRVLCRSCKALRTEFCCAPWAEG